MSINNKLIVLLTGIIAVATVIYTVVAGYTLHEIHSGSSDTHALAEAAKTQADKMKSVSDAAEKIRLASEGMVAQEKRLADKTEEALEASNGQSRDALSASIRVSRLDQRAWLGTGDYTYSITESGPITSTTIIGNTGKTPAMSVVCRITGTTKVKNDALAKSDIVYPAELPTLNQGTLYPNQHFPLSAGGPPMDPAKQKVWFNNVQNGDWVVYFFGEIKYSDTFRKNHWTHFCTVFVPSTKSGTPCSIYNEAGDGESP